MLNSIFLIVILIFSINLHAAEQKPLEKELKQHQNKVETLKHQLQSKKNKESHHLQALSVLEKKRQALTHNADKLNAAIADTEKQLTQLQGIQEDIQKSLQKKKQSLAKQLKSFYMLQKNDRLKLFLTQKDINSIERLMHYFYYIEKHQHTLLSSVMMELHALEQHQIEMQGMRDKLHQLKTEEQQLLKHLAEEQQKRTQVMMALKKDIQHTEQALEHAKTQETALSTQLTTIQAQLQKRAGFSQDAPFRQAQGKLLWPLRKQVRSSLKPPFMIKAPIGDWVYATFDGQVVFADWLRGFGLLMIIDHGDGILSLYGHNQALYKNVGDRLKKGEVIAKVGDSGGLENSGLYFEIRKNGKPLNLVNWFK